MSRYEKVRNVLFSRNLLWFAFLLPAFGDLIFCLIKDDVKHIKLFKIKVLVAAIKLLHYDLLLKFVKLKLRYVSSFRCTWKKDGKVFRKNTTTFRHNIAYMVNLFCFSLHMLIMTVADKNYSKIWTRKWKKNIKCIAIIMTHQCFTVILICHCWR